MNPAPAAPSGPRRIDADGAAWLLHDAADALLQARNGGVAIDEGPLLLDGADLLIDALLGLGGRLPLPATIIEAIEQINRATCPVLAVDLPSGLDPDTGQPRGAAAVHAKATLSLLDPAAPAFDAQRPELMLRSTWWQEPPALLSAATVVCGCGGAAAVAVALPALLSHAGRLVLDADALNAIAADSALATLLRARATRGRPTVLTPHPLEAARLLGCSVQEVQRDRLAAAAALAERHGCVVVLKGSGTVVAEPGTLPCINPTGNALLASAGTGDVLAGWIGGTWAAGAPSISAVQAARASVWLHGRAADLEAARGRGAAALRAADLIDSMHDAAAGSIGPAINNSGVYGG